MGEGKIMNAQYPTVTLSYPCLWWTRWNVRGGEAAVAIADQICVSVGEDPVVVAVAAVVVVVVAAGAVVAAAAVAVVH